MEAALADKNEQLLQIEANNKEEMNRIAAEATEQVESIKKMHDEAIKETNKQIQDLEEKQENFLKIIEKKNYESTFPKPSFLIEHQVQNQKAFYIQILGCRGAGKSTFLNRFFQATGLRNFLEFIFKELNFAMMKPKIAKLDKIKISC